MDDNKVLDRINDLAREEHELFERESHGKVTDADRERLRRLQVTLDQCWDCSARDGRGGRRDSTRTKHGFETRKPLRATRADHETPAHALLSNAEDAAPSSCPLGQVQQIQPTGGMGSIGSPQLPQIGSSITLPASTSRSSWVEVLMVLRRS